MFTRFSLILCIILAALSVFNNVRGLEYIVRNAAELNAALNAVNPGDRIQLQKSNRNSAHYPLIFGNFVAARNGTARNPVYLIGKADVGLTSNTPYASSLEIRGQHWVVRGFQIVASSSSRYEEGRALSIIQSKYVHVEHVRIKSRDTSIIESSSNVTIKNCNIRSRNHGISLEGDSQGIHILNNRFTFEGSASGSANAIYAEGSTNFGLIDGNRFKSPQNLWNYWVYMEGNNYLIRNNTGDLVSNAGFYVSDGTDWNGMTGVNNTFQLNRCMKVTFGRYCIELERSLFNSTCISRDNTYDYAPGRLSNKKGFCDTRSQQHFVN